MKIQGINQGIFFLQIMGLFLVAFILQLTFWPRIWQNHVPAPQVYLILFIYFSLYSSFVFSIFLIYGISLLIGGFSSLSVSSFFATFLCFYCLLLAAKGFFHWKKLKFFLFASFCISLTFPFLLKMFSDGNMVNSLFAWTLNGVLTATLAYFSHPLLETYRGNHLSP